MEQKVLAIIAELLETPKELLHPDSSPETLARWDSTNHMRMIIGLEEAFGIVFEDDQIVELTTVQKVIDAVKLLSPA